MLGAGECAGKPAPRPLPVNGRGRFSGRAGPRLQPRTQVLCVIVVLLTAGPPVRLTAQSGSVLAGLPGSTRAAGLRGAGAALVGDAGGVFSNPAGIATIRHLSFEGAYQRSAYGTTVGSGALAQGAYRLLTTLEGQWPSGAGGLVIVGVEGGVVTHGVGIVGRVGYGGRSGATPASRSSYGAGLELGRLHLDYAYRAFDAPAGGTHRFGLQWTP